MKKEGLFLRHSERRGDKMRRRKKGMFADYDEKSPLDLVRKSEGDRGNERLKEREKRGTTEEKRGVACSLFRQGKE